MNKCRICRRPSVGLLCPKHQAQRDRMMWPLAAIRLREQMMQTSETVPDRVPREK
jgi:hypothetical protein